MAFDTWIAQAGILVAGTLSPGPNNTLAIGAAMRDGLRGALRIGLGVVAGGLAMLVIASTGLGAMLASHPMLAEWAMWLGIAYLIALGIRMMFPTAPAQTGARPVVSAVEVLVLQFVNPKAWTLMLALVAMDPHASQQASIAFLAMLFAVVSCSSLFLWSLAGVWLAGRRGLAPHARRIDRILGGLLIASAITAAITYAS